MNSRAWALIALPVWAVLVVLGLCAFTAYGFFRERVEESQDLLNPSYPRLISASPRGGGVALKLVVFGRHDLPLLRREVVLSRAQAREAAQSLLKACGEPSPQETIP